VLTFEIRISQSLLLLFSAIGSLAALTSQALVIAEIVYFVIMYL